MTYFIVQTAGLDKPEIIREDGEPVCFQTITMAKNWIKKKRKENPEAAFDVWGQYLKDVNGHMLPNMVLVYRYIGKG